VRGYTAVLVENEQKLLVVVDDGTGLVSCSRWSKGPYPQEESNVNVGDLLTVRGRPKCFLG
jgi:hypothetical protein